MPSRFTRHWRDGALGAIAVATCLMFVVGCGYKSGALLYIMGAGRAQKVEAKFVLTENPVLIFVDDFRGRVTLPGAKYDLTDQLAQELLRKEAAKKIVPYETLQRLQQSNTEFAEKSCREIAELAGAEQAIWIEVRDFLVTEEIVSGNDAALITVTVKVINALEKENRVAVRLWPTDMDGHAMSSSLNGSDVQRLKTREAISEELTLDLSTKIAKLFYDHRVDDFDKKE